MSPSAPLCSCGAYGHYGCAFVKGSISFAEPTCRWPNSRYGEWITDAFDLLGEPDPGPTPFLVDGLIVEQALVAAVGKWKAMKSYSLLDIAISVATGRPAFGKLAVIERDYSRRVIYICEESGRAALQRRTDSLCRGRAIDRDELRGHLLLAANARVRLDDPKWQNELLDICEEADLVIFDPLARMMMPGRDENAKKEMAEVIDFWRLLRDETGAAVALVMHVGHGGGDHIRGTSDLESVWETKLVWERDGQSPTVKIKSEHREAETAGPHSFLANYDSLTRSMRFDLVDDSTDDSREADIKKYLTEHPDASANAVHEHVKGNRQEVLATVKRIKDHALRDAIDDLVAGGSSALEPPGTTPSQAPVGGVVPSPPVRGAGTTTEAPGSNGSEPPLVDEADEARYRSLFEGGDPEFAEAGA